MRQVNDTPDPQHSSMDEKFISANYPTDCYHSRQTADQHIHVMPNRADVTCGNCGATRVFIPLNEDVDERAFLSNRGHGRSGLFWHLQYAGTVVLTGLMISPSVAVLSR